MGTIMMMTVIAVMTDTHFLTRCNGNLDYKNYSMNMAPFLIRKLLSQYRFGFGLTTLYSIPGLDVHLMCHLLELFVLLSSAQIQHLLSPVTIQSQLSSGTMPRCLILAACASAVRFSVHTAVTRPSARHFAERIVLEARKCIRIPGDFTTQVNTINTICILVEYTASIAHGRQAWVDISTGEALIQLARLECEMDAEVGALNAAGRYLAGARLTHCLGHPGLYPPYRQFSKTPRPDSRSRTPGGGPPDLVSLLEIFTRVHQLQSVPVKDQEPPPWAPHSAFRALQNELEEHLLHYPSTFHLFLRPRSHYSEQQDPDELICALMWHCCVVVLNRSFLPAAMKTSIGNGSEQNIQRVDVPGAPCLFVKEKAHRCESSANAIFQITGDIVRASGFHLYAALVGYACMQGALVSIERLHCSRKPYEATTVGNLRMTFVVLGVLKTFYAPAEEWLNVVIQAHDPNTKPTLTSDNIDMVFNDYFSRFINIQEPAFVPLEPRDKDTPKDAIEALQSNRSIDCQKEISPKNNNWADIATSKRDSEWLQDYSGHLSGDIESESAVDEVDENTNTTAAVGGPTHSSATIEPPRSPATNEEQIQDAFIVESETAGSPEHMGAAILAAMSGNMGSPSTQLCDSDPEQLSLDFFRNPFLMRPNEGYTAPHDQMPPFSELFGLNLNMSMFPGLDLVMSDSTMLSDVFNSDDAPRFSTFY
ncbi:C6 transcription factor [Cordyceps militaris]|uniref:C6 transcription factor n=1 Tax=Cordyceps militaris TaxID=73501 RepID=A0A2H4ST97_CORMI|nr:C6 transcription factor [Cordyceps militaris]